MMGLSSNRLEMEHQVKREIENLLRCGKSSADLVKILHAICDPVGRAEGITVSCGGFAPHRLVCMIRMGDEPEATQLAGHLGVIAGGTADVIFSYELPPDFICLSELIKSTSACLCFPAVIDIAHIA